VGAHADPNTKWLQAIALAHGLPDTYSTAGLDATLDGIV
jgi:hypothetical protein